MPLKSETDVVVVGAGFSGIYMLHKLRNLMDLNVQGIEKGLSVGGTWYWNRYPGARCDVESIDYAFTFDAALDAKWQWKEKFPTQPQILAYLEHATDHFDLRNDLAFDSSVKKAVWNEKTSRWVITVQVGDTCNADETKEIVCRYYVMASGCLSIPKQVDLEGLDSFAGETYSTSSWPDQKIDFTGKSVGVIGTGSTGVQLIPMLAKEAAQMTVFQRTPAYSIPARHGPLDPEKIAYLERDRVSYNKEKRANIYGLQQMEKPVDVAAFSVSEEERNKRYEEAWLHGGLSFLTTFNDLLLNDEANETAAEFVRNKIRVTVKDPKSAASLCPKSYPFGTKRLCLDDGYYETYNLEHVRLVDLQEHGIETITKDGIRTKDGTEHQFDVLVLATGFDAMTGALVSVDVTGRDGVTLASKWKDGPQTYLGLMTKDFPNFFTVTGPGSPSVLSNMLTSIEQHVEWICDAIGHVDSQRPSYETMEPSTTAETAWGTHVTTMANYTLHMKAATWYLGANVPGKPRVFLPYIGGCSPYRGICDEVVEKDYMGFEFRGPSGSKQNDGVIR